MTGAVASKLDSMRAKGAMKHRDVADLLGQRPETVSRWNQGRAYPHPSTEKTLLGWNSSSTSSRTSTRRTRPGSGCSRLRNYWMARHRPN